MKKISVLQLYEDIFEKPFLAATGEYYKEEAQKLLQPNSISIYMEKVIQRIESENVRSRKFLYPSSYQKVSASLFLLCMYNKSFQHIIHTTPTCLIDIHR